MSVLKLIGTPLYQWETGRKLEVGPVHCTGVRYVHFANQGDTEALSVELKEESGVFTAAIPNILLQSGTKIVAFYVSISSDCTETLCERTFNVHARPKPADYVYTETEVLNYTKLDKRITYLENEGLEKAVSDYLEEHPVEGVTENELVEAVNDALEQAKESGQFDGKDGADGKDGVSVRHSWNGTILTITSASGTSSADLKGADGDTAMLEPLTVTVSEGDNFSITPSHTGAEILAALTAGRQVGLLFGGTLLNIMGVYDGQITFCPILYGGAMILIYVDSETDAVGWHTHEYMPADALPNAVSEALAQAKASGEFDGKDGKDGVDGYTPQKNIDYFDGKDGKNGVDGTDGITPHIGNNGNWYIGTTDTGKPSRGVDGKDGKDGAQGEQGIQGVKGDTGAQGAKGDKGDTGANGVSATHSWNGTVLTVTSASGTSSADLRGAKGDTGAQGIQGEKGATGDKGDKGDTGATGASGKDGTNGKDGTSVTVKSVSESSADGGNNVVTFSDGKTMTVKNGSKGSTGGKGADGVSPTVSVSKSGKVTTISITDANGTKTATINDGSDGADGKDGSNGKDGTSVTHSWSGTTLSVTSASGTSSANLKGEKGDKGDSVKGDKGDTGDAGVGISSVKQTTTSTADDGNNVITVTLTNGTTSTFTVQNGSKGSSGSNGKDGKTPVKGTDYFTAADKTEMVNSIKAALPTLTVTGVDADGNTHTWTMYGVKN